MSGGWKKLSNINVKKDLLLKELVKKTNLNPNNILDIYGFTEQLGTVSIRMDTKDVMSNLTLM